jgi:hypothetical protein
MAGTGAFAAALWLGLGAAGAAAQDRQEIITDLKELQKQLGFPETRNFLTHSDQKAYYRCYYTGKLELPASYEELGYKRGDEAGCNLDERKYDVFFYPVQAVASGNAPVTSSLAESSLERLLVVVPHEDFHHEAEDTKLPPAIPEAAATLIGFLTAAEFARTRYGEDSGTYRKLAGEADLFLRKATVVNAYHEKIGRLFERVRVRELTDAQGLAAKDELFDELKKACGAIGPDPASFNKCPAVNNNAGLAFDLTYTKAYPVLHRVYDLYGRDLNATIAALRFLVSRKWASETEALNYIRSLTLGVHHSETSIIPERAAGLALVHLFPPGGPAPFHLPEDVGPLR